MLKKFFFCILAGILISTPCLASTLPSAENNGNSIGIGLTCLSADVKLTQESGLGFSLGIPLFYYKQYGVARYDIRYLYVLSKDEKLAISGLIGVWGDTDILVPSTVKYSPIGIEAGLLLSYFITPQVIARVNIVAGTPLWIWDQNPLGYFSPSGGFGIGYKFIDNMEATASLTGQGDFIGLKIIF